MCVRGEFVGVGRSWTDSRASSTPYHIQEKQEESEAPCIPNDPLPSLSAVVAHVCAQEERFKMVREGGERHGSMNVVDSGETRETMAKHETAA
jgi:hypothetical protein